ncbi:hypothetical protein [Mucisphaera sp.]|uniref:hypothetical protein n=1 Tax=Mucisphaera sp. TaxID=2913024 RepID=UPI003D14C997
MKPWLDEILKRYRAEPTKVTILAGMTVFGMLLWGRLLLKDPPRVVTAEPETQAVAVESASPQPTPPARALPEGPTVTVTVPEYRPRNIFQEPQLTPAPESDQPVPQVQPQTSDTSLRNTVRNQAMELNLQAIILGREPKAVINGQYVGPGDAIDGFTLRTLERRHAELEMQGVIVRLGLP